MDFDDDREREPIKPRESFFPERYSIDNLIPQRMPGELYKEYIIYHTGNQKRLKNSINNPIKWEKNSINFSPMGYCEDPRFMDFPYGESTLGISGCGPFSISQALGIPIELVTKVLSEQGYYYKGNGTWHMALDRLGARECDDVRQISRALKEGKVVTMLANGHFRNIVGVEVIDNSYCFQICDSSDERPYYYEKINDALSTMLSAWVWE